jgi:hypothetical protein
LALSALWEGFTPALGGHRALKGKMKKSDPAKRKSREQFSTPVWMSDAIVEKAKTMDPGTRIEFAERLERAAAELREFKPPPIEPVAVARVHLKPNAKQSILYYAKRHGISPEFSEQDQLDCGARWIIEQALCIIQTVSDEADIRVLYRDAEDMEHTHQIEKIIGTELERYKMQSEES